jgi:4-carboxymuconolactone decarboxylase
MSRCPILDEASFTKDQQRVYDQIVTGPRGKVIGPLRVWLQSPGLAEKAQALGQYARYDSVLPEYLSELAILVTARFWSSGFEWSHHAPIGLAAGIPVQALDAISKAELFSFSTNEMQCVFDMAVELHRDRNVSDVTYSRTLKTLGLQSCVDIVGICGYYTLISMTINVFDVPNSGEFTLPALDFGTPDYFRT